MNLLAVDTSGPVAGVAVLRDGEVASSRVVRKGLRFALVMGNASLK